MQNDTEDQLVSCDRGEYPASKKRDEMEHQSKLDVFINSQDLESDDPEIIYDALIAITKFSHKDYKKPSSK